VPFGERTFRELGETTVLELFLEGYCNALLAGERCRGQDLWGGEWGVAYLGATGNTLRWELRGHGSGMDWGGVVGVKRHPRSEDEWLWRMTGTSCAEPIRYSRSDSGHLSSLTWGNVVSLREAQVPPMGLQ
jgi:hypothetical protein